MNQICPECDVENEKDAKRCKGCSYPLAAQTDFERMAKATSKKIKKSNETKPVEEKEDGGFFDVLG